jgi:DNA-binding GntR family transcriptional regulator
MRRERELATERINLRRRVRLVDEVAEELRERIYAGDYALGEPLRQEALAEDLQVSRTPLREAIRVLENEGLLYSERNRTVRVVSGDVKKFLAAYQLREVLDGLAARLAAASSDQAGRQAPSEIIERQHAALDPWDHAAYTAANVEFHKAVMDLADNEYLSAQLPIVRMTSQVFGPVRLLEPERAASAVEQHRQIAAAIAAGDTEESERLARAHIRSTMDSIAQRDDAESVEEPAS